MCQCRARGTYNEGIEMDLRIIDNTLVLAMLMIKDHVDDEIREAMGRAPRQSLWPCLRC